MWFALILSTIHLFAFCVMCCSAAQGHLLSNYYAANAVCKLICYLFAIKRLQSMCSCLRLRLLLCVSICLFVVIHSITFVHFYSKQTAENVFNSSKTSYWSIGLQTEQNKSESFYIRFDLRHQHWMYVRNRNLNPIGCSFSMQWK